MWITKNGQAVRAVYNEFGELVEADLEVRTAIAANFTVTELLRTIKKEFHHEFRTFLQDITLPQIDDEGTVSTYSGIQASNVAHYQH